MCVCVCVCVYVCVCLRIIIFLLAILPPFSGVLSKLNESFFVQIEFLHILNESLFCSPQNEFLLLFIFMPKELFSQEVGCTFYNIYLTCKVLYCPGYIAYVILYFHVTIWIFSSGARPH